MCISIPGEVILIKGEKAKIKQGNHFHWVDTGSLESKVKKGDYLIVYQGAAVNKIPAREAKDILKLMDGAGDAGVKRAD